MLAGGVKDTDVNVVDAGENYVSHCHGIELVVDEKRHGGGVVEENLVAVMNVGDLYVVVARVDDLSDVLEVDLQIW